MFIIQGPHQPAVAVLGGVTYVVSGNHWLPVPSGTTLANVQYDAPVPPTPVVVQTLARTVASGRDPSTTYDVVVRTDGVQRCTCSGFMYRRTCRHVVALTKELAHAVPR